MSRRELDSGLDKIVGMAAEKVVGFGFARRGSALQILDDGNAGLIEFQKSPANSKDNLRFTIDLAVICGALLESWQPPLTKAKSIDAHLRVRIGFLTLGRPDKWWEITNTTNVDAVAAEVSELIATEGAPYVGRYLHTDDLIALWASGQSPGLTETQRRRYLERLGSR